MCPYFINVQMPLPHSTMQCLLSTTTLCVGLLLFGDVSTVQLLAARGSEVVLYISVT